MLDTDIRRLLDQLAQRLEADGIQPDSISIDFSYERLVTGEKLRTGASYTILGA